MQIDAERQARLVAGLAENKLQALIVISSTDVLLLSGYCPVMSSSVAIITASGEICVILPEDEVELASKTSGATLIPYKPETLDKLSNPTAALRSSLGDTLRKLGLEHAAIGMRRSLSMSPSAYAVSTVFHDSLPAFVTDLEPAAQIHPADDLLEKQRSRATSRELGAIQRSANIASAGFAVAEASIEAGLREADVGSTIQAAFDRTPDLQGAERCYGFFFCMSGPNSASAAAAFARTRQRRIEPGDLVMIHANTFADGYWTDITRTYTAGPPSERNRGLRSAILEARQAALHAIHPGVQASVVDHAARSVMEAHGLGKAFKHATGHGVGYAAANPNALPRIHPQSPDVLEAGMCFNLEPAAYFEGYGGMRHCDMVAVTPDGVNVLTDF